MKPIEKMTSDELAKRIVTRRERKARSIAKTHDFERFEKDLFEVLKREIKQLLDESHLGPLRAERARALMDYLKVSRELKEHKRLEEEINRLEGSKNEQK